MVFSLSVSKMLVAKHTLFMFKAIEAEKILKELRSDFENRIRLLSGCLKDLEKRMKRIDKALEELKELRKLK